MFHSPFAEAAVPGYARSPLALPGAHLFSSAPAAENRKDARVIPLSFPLHFRVRARKAESGKSTSNFTSFTVTTVSPIEGEDCTILNGMTMPPTVR